MKSEIAKKLKKATRLFFEAEDNFLQEIIVVYFMVELRKVLDHKRERSNFKTLRFYADWCVHTSKDKITPEMKNLLSLLCKELNHNKKKSAQIKSSRSILINEIINKDCLRREIKSLLEQEGAIGSVDITEGPDWDDFLNATTRILQNQSLINPGGDVQKITFLPSEDYTFHLLIEFRDDTTKQYMCYKALGIL